MREHNQPSLFFPDPAIEHVCVDDDDDDGHLPLYEHVCVDDDDEEEEADERGPNGYEG